VRDIVDEYEHHVRQQYRIDVRERSEYEAGEVDYETEGVLIVVCIYLIQLRPFMVVSSISCMVVWYDSNLFLKKGFSIMISTNFY
jgi:hypothetical protein